MPRPDALLQALQFALRPLGYAYGGVMRLRNARYDRDPRRTTSVDVPVISVGNLTVGGTGKTPLVIELARRLIAIGRRPAILTRGYGAAAGRVADEALEFARATPDTPVVIDADRVRGARSAIREHRADCLLLDDGFQHRRLGRDLDILVVDALDPWGGQRCLPAGRLREPLTGFSRADVIVLSRANQAQPKELVEIEARLDALAPAAPRVRANVVLAGLEWDRDPSDSDASRPGPPASTDLNTSFEPRHISLPGVRLADASAKPDGPAPLDATCASGPSTGDPATEELSYLSILPLSGIGAPITFERLLGEFAGRLCEPLRFRDHHPYRPSDVPRIFDAARSRGADAIATTRKDWVKLAPLWPASAPTRLVVVDVRTELADPRGVMQRELESALSKQPRRNSGFRRGNRAATPPG